MNRGQFPGYFPGRFLVAFSISICALTGRSLAQATPAMPFAGQDEVQEVESQVPGETQIVRWDALLNQTGADAVNKIGVPATTSSVLYAAMTCNGFEMRSAISDANTNGGVEGLGQQMVFAQSFGGNGPMQMQRQMYFNYFNNTNPNSVRMNFQLLQDQETYSRQPDDHLHVRLNASDLNGQIMEARSSSRLTQKASIDYDGDVAPGDAIAFMAPIKTKSNKTYYQLTVWETFKAPSSITQEFQSLNSSAWWVQNGPSKLRKQAGIAALWEAQSAHAAEDVPPSFQKKLDDGKILRLVALCRPSDALFCWWDGQGRPVSNVRNANVNFDSAGNPTKGLWAFIEVTGTGREYRMASPATRPIMDMSNRYPSADQPYNQSAFVQVPDGATSVGAGAYVGDWTEFGQLKLGEDQEIDGVTYKVTAQMQQPRNVNALAVQSLSVVTLEQSAPTDFLVAASGVNADGLEAASSGGFFGVITNRNGQYGMVMNANGQQIQPPPGPRRMGFALQGLAIDDVKYFRLCKRKLQWVTFDGLAAEPLTPIKTDFTPDELTAGLKNQQVIQAQQQRQATIDAAMLSVHDHANWDAVDPDPAMPMGMLKLLFTAAGNADEKTVRQYLNGGDPQGVDALVHFYLVSQSNWQHAVKLFGQNDLLALQLSGTPVQDISRSFLQFDWTKKDDGSWTGGPAVLRKDSSGNYALDLSALAANPDAIAQVKAASDIQDRIAKALDQPNLTIDQLRAAAKPAQ